LACIESNFQRSLIEHEAYLVAKSISEGQTKIVGINSGVATEDDSLSNSSDFMNKGPYVKKDFVENFSNIDGDTFQELINSAIGETNIMYPIKKLLVKNISMSQIVDVLKSQWGCFQN
jgi:methylmalonyl-CoA mutase N-terminal domain/subunit